MSFDEPRSFKRCFLALWARVVRWLLQWLFVLTVMATGIVPTSSSSRIVIGIACFLARRTGFSSLPASDELRGHPIAIYTLRWRWWVGCAAGLARHVMVQ